MKKISSAFRVFGKTQHTSKDELATKIVKDLKNSGVTKTRKLNVIDNTLVLRQINAMCRDINNDRKGWWNTLKVVDEKKKFQLLMKVSA